MGSVNSLGKVSLLTIYRPSDATNHNSYYLSNRIDVYEQTGYSFGGVLRIGSHFIFVVGVGRARINDYVTWGIIKYPSTNAIHENSLWMTSNLYYLSDTYIQNIWTTWWEFGVLITIKNYAIDAFITYTPLINTKMFSMGIGGAF